MKLYKVSKQNQKHPRETKDNIILYHVSPEKLSFLSGRSRFNGHTGLYLSQSYRSTITDWSDYVKNKKLKNHPVTQRIKEIKKELENNENTPKEEELYNELDKLNKSIENVEKEIGDRSYKTLYIHKISCPKVIYNKCMEWFSSFYDENNFGFWGWGEQVFVLSEYLKNCQILSVKEFKLGDLRDEYSNLMRRKPSYPDTIYDK